MNSGAANRGICMCSQVNTDCNARRDDAQNDDALSCSLNVIKNFFGVYLFIVDSSCSIIRSLKKQNSLPGHTRVNLFPRSQMFIQGRVYLTNILANRWRALLCHLEYWKNSLEGVASLSLRYFSRMVEQLRLAFSGEVTPCASFGVPLPHPAVLKNQGAKSTGKLASGVSVCIQKAAEGGQSLGKSEAKQTEQRSLCLIQKLFN